MQCTFSIRTFVAFMFSLSHAVVLAQTMPERVSEGMVQLVTVPPLGTEDDSRAQSRIDVYFLSESEAEAALANVGYNILDERSPPILFDYCATKLDRKVHMVRPTQPGGLVIAVARVRRSEVRHEWQTVSLKSFEVSKDNVRISAFVRAGKLWNADADRKAMYIVAAIPGLGAGTINVSVKFVPLEDEALRGAIERRSISRDAIKKWGAADFELVVE